MDEPGTYPVEIRRRSLSEALEYVATDVIDHTDRYTPVALSVLLLTFADQARDLERRATAQQEHDRIEQLREDADAGVALADIGRNLGDVVMDCTEPNGVVRWSATYVPRGVTGYGTTEDEALRVMVMYLANPRNDGHGAR